MTGDAELIRQLIQSRPVPKIIRDKAEWCGPASAVTVLDFFGKKGISQQEIADLAHYDIKWGTTQEGLTAAIEKKDLYTAAHQNLTLDELDQLLALDKLAIIDYMDWDPKNPDPNEDGHYAVYIGRADGKVCLMCSYRGAILIDEKEFVKNWWDIVDRKGTVVKGWALVISPHPLAEEATAAS